MSIDMSCIFCAIASGEEDALVLDETDETIAFASLEPVSEGHLLVVPKDHYESLFDIPESTLCTMMKRTKTIATHLHASGFDGVNVLHASGSAAQQSVPHFHIHLAPRRCTDELDLWPDSSYEKPDSDGIYDAVRSALNREQ